MNVLVAIDVQVVSSSNANKQETTAETDVLIAVTPTCSLGVQKIAFQKD